MEAHKGKSPALPSVLVLRNVDISNLAVLFKEVLQVTVRGPVGQVVHLQGHHLRDIWGRSSSRHLQGLQI